jgi:hypothetical protein
MDIFPFQEKIKQNLRYLRSGLHHGGHGITQIILLFVDIFHITIKYHISAAPAFFFRRPRGSVADVADFIIIFI